MLEGLAAVAPDDAAAAMAAGLDTMILLSPEDAPRPAGGRFKPFQLPPGEEVQGREFQTRGLRPSRRDRLVIGDEGLTLTTAGDPEPLTVRWDDVAAVTRERDGSVCITATNGTWLMVRPTTFKDVAGVREQLERHLDSGALVPEPDAAAAAAVDRVVTTTLPKELDRPRRAEVAPG